MDKSFVGVRELAVNMSVSEKTIYRMLNDNQFPFAVKIGGQWRFRKDAVDSWICSQTQGESKVGKINYGITFAEALQHGAVLFRIHGSNRDEALNALLEALPHNSNFDQKKIKLSVLIRESLAPSCLGGIACMTISSDHPVYMDKSIVILAFLEKPTDFKALDRQLAQAVFLILGANSCEQAILETRLRRLLMEKIFIDDILQQPGRKEILQMVKDWESKLLAGHWK